MLNQYLCVKHTLGVWSSFAVGNEQHFAGLWYCYFGIWAILNQEMVLKLLCPGVRLLQTSPYWHATIIFPNLVQSVIVIATSSCHQFIFFNVVTLYLYCESWDYFPECPWCWLFRIRHIGGYTPSLSEGLLRIDNFPSLLFQWLPSLVHFLPMFLPFSCQPNLVLAALSCNGHKVWNAHYGRLSDITEISVTEKSNWK